MNKILIIIAIFIYLPIHSWSNSYALVVGINNYIEANQLKGAVADAESISKLLKSRGVDSVKILKDSYATRENILFWLKQIADKVHKKDRFYMFFSGHGTSLQDASFSETYKGDTKLLAMMENSGALIPVDFSFKNARETLIIGNRDLRPFFEKIDQHGAASLVVFDACFSGMTSRSLPSKQTIRRHLIISDEINFENISKDTKLRQLVPTNKIFFTPKPNNPYKHLIYVASTSTSDWAVEDRKTKRGYLSQQIEQCLSGIGDYDHDMRIFKKELELCLENSDLPQAPQVYPRDGQTDQFVIDNIIGVTKPDTLKVDSASDSYVISDNYSQLQQFSNPDEVARFKKAYQIFRLKGAKNFSMVAYDNMDPYTVKKTFSKGDEFTIAMTSDMHGYLALFSIDPKGSFYLLEPYGDDIQIQPNRQYKYGESAVEEPVGIDLIKAFLFYDKKYLDKLREFQTDENGKVQTIQEIGEIYDYLQRVPVSAYETAFLKLFTKK